MVSVFAVHPPQCRFCNQAARCSKEHTNLLRRHCGEYRHKVHDHHLNLLKNILCDQYLSRSPLWISGVDSGTFDNPSISFNSTHRKPTRNAKADAALRDRTERLKMPST